MPSTIPQDYTITDQVHSKPRHMKVIHVGAGAAGLLAAYKARRGELQNAELICYEKNPTIGGTWYENRYPGCACDIPAHTYTYTFEPNPEWSGFYSFADEIQAYFVRFYEKYALQSYMRFNTKVVSATWIEAEGEWELELEKEGRAFKDRCHVLINGSGVVNKWKWPAIEGRESYKGIMAHSANWDTSIDWKGRRVAMLGTGSSSIQMVPRLAQGSESVTIFARNTFYIAPQIASDVQKADPSGAAPAAAGKHYYIEAEKERFRNDREYFLEYRKGLETALTKQFPMFLRGTEINVYAKAAIQQLMAQKLGPEHQDLKEKIIPTWSPGCRRLTPGEGYLETLTQKHVKFVQDEVVRFTPTGLVTAVGEELEFDIIACATGFNVAYVPHFKIVGVNGAVMTEEWADSPNIYLSITAPKFPSYFVINGPTGNWGQGCTLPSVCPKHEVQMDYIFQCIRKMQDDGIKALEVRQEPTTQLNQHIDTWHKDYSVWAEDCKSWYKDNKPHGRVYIWPGSLLHHLKTLRSPRYEHYYVRYWNENMWAFLGNGRTELEMQVESGKKLDMAPYIRNEYTPWNLEVPYNAQAEE